MTFCGQCGLQLASGEMRCPRCGTLVEPDFPMTNPARPAEAYEANAPTTQSPSLLGRQPQPPLGPPMQPSQQKLVLPSMPDNTHNQGYTTQGAYDATIRQPGAPGTQMRTSSPGYQPQTGGNYTPPRTSYPGYTQPPAGFQQGGSQYQDYQQHPVQHNTGAPTSKGRTMALVLILLGLLFILVALVLFILQHNGTLAHSSITTGSSTTTVPVTQRARTLIESYYTHINSHAYREAYQLWKPGANKQSFVSFKNGFQNTVRDHLTINDIVEQGDGTVKVSVTVDATETTPNAGTRYSTYQGYYIVEPQSNGSLEIINGILNPA
jgi:hypothetical protein